MQNKLFTAVGALILGVGILAATTQGCGGSSVTARDGGAGTGGGGLADAIDTCNKFCDKEATCMPLFTAAACKSSICSKIAASGTGGATGTSGTADSCGGITIAQFQAKLNNCLSMSCATFLSCAAAICPSSTGGAGTGGGAAGTSGGAGTSGSAGTTGAAGFNFDGGLPFDANIFDGGLSLDAGGSTCATACVKADSCCNALATAGVTGAGACNLKTTCDGAGANASSVVAGCNGYLLSASFIASAQGKTVPAACQ